MKLRKSDRIGRIAADNIETVPVFNYYGINFYAEGNRTLEEVCIDDNVPIVSLLEDLSRTEDGGKDLPDFTHMSMKQLTNYIVRRHHRFTEGKLVFIKHTLVTIMSEYDIALEILGPIKEAFDELSLRLTVQMNHEEFIIFPFLVKMEKNRTMSLPEYKRMMQPIVSMRKESEHDVEKIEMLGRAVRNCSVRRGHENIYPITCEAMTELENDLKIHMHLENNILFPHALDFAHRVSTNWN